MWKACRWPGLAVGLELANLWQRFHHLEGLTPLQNFEHSHDPNSEAEWLFCLAILLLGPFPMLRAFSNCFARPEALTTMPRVKFVLPRISHEI